ncbi:MAG: RNA polymerase sigma factor [Syntrophothermus sp.]
MAKEISTSNTDEIELIERCRNGEQQAFTEIVRRYKGKVASTVTGMLGPGDHAEDIGQEVFIRLFKAIASFRGDSSLGTYITRIAINLSLNEIKRRKLRRLLSFEGLKEDGVDIEDKGSDDLLDENKEIVRKAIQKLSVKYRSVVVLRLIDNYSTEETAKILNLPPGTVLSRLARAQIKLKEYLKPYILEI